VAILKLRPVRYRSRDRNLDAQRGEQIGFLAQDIEKVFPEFVSTSSADIQIDLAGGKSEGIQGAKGGQLCRDCRAAREGSAATQGK
jgi:Chaperone of endosialidase